MRDSDLSVLKIMVGSEGASNLTSAEKLGRGRLPVASVPRFVSALVSGCHPSYSPSHFCITTRGTASNPRWL
jgi:hypothetical protein